MINSITGLCVVIGIFLFFRFIVLAFNGCYDVTKNEIVDSFENNGIKYYIHKITYDDGHVKYKKYKV